jgi:hypothetical protein
MKNQATALVESAQEAIENIVFRSWYSAQVVARRVESVGDKFYRSDYDGARNQPNHILTRTEKKT